MSRARHLFIAALGISLMAASCGTALSGDWTFEIRAADAPTRLPVDSVDDGGLLNIIARSITEDLKLRLPDIVPYEAYGSEQAFVEALIAQGVSVERARQRGRSAVATALRRTRILARGDVLSRRPIAERAVVYAHELAHVAQARFANGENHVPIWMWEGHADWVGYRVAGLLGLKAYVDSRRAIRWSAAFTMQRAPLPPLSLLHASERWRVANERGATAIYGQAFLAIDWLVERYGEERLRGYLESHTHSKALAGADDFAPPNWRLAFPIDYDDFVLQFRRYLTATP